MSHENSENLAIGLRKSRSLYRFGGLRDLANHFMLCGGSRDSEHWDKKFGTKFFKFSKVDCGKEVTCERIKAYLYKRGQNLTQRELDVFHTAMAEIESIRPRTLLKNCELKIMTGNFNGKLETSSQFVHTFTLSSE